MSEETRQPDTYRPRTTFFGDPAANVLAEHALTLPEADPVRETLRLILDRWTQGASVSFLDDQDEEGLQPILKEAA